MFCYYAEDTVERNILDLAARRGQSLYTKDHAAGTLTAGPITAPVKSGIDAPKKRAQKGDFVFKCVPTSFEGACTDFIPKDGGYAGDLLPTLV